MAYVDPSTYSPAVAPQPQQQQGMMGPVSAGGQGLASSTTKASATPGVNVPQQPSAQLKDYISANAPQTQQFAGQVSGQLGAQTQAAGNAIQPAVSQYAGNLYTVPTNAEANQAVATAPSQLTADQKTAFQTELQAGQNAPNSAGTFETTQPYKDLIQNIQSAVTQANLWNAGNNIPSISTAIQPFEAPNATQGIRTLDALLLSQTPGTYNQIEQAVAPAANLQGQLQTGATQADQALQAAIAQDTAATQSANQAAQTYTGNLADYLKNTAATQTQAETAQNAQILKDLQSNTPTQADLATLNITPDQWNTLSGEVSAATKANPKFSLADYLTQSTPNITPENLATAQQYQDVAALQGLLGPNAPVAPITATTANEAGTATTPAALNQFNLAAAETGAKLAPLEAQAQQIVNAGNFANSQYVGNNHFGGQSPQQFNNYIAGLNAQLQAINSKMQQIGASANQQAAINGVPIPGNGGPTFGDIAKGGAATLFPSIALANIPLIKPLESVAQSIGSFFGLAEGGEVRRDDNPQGILAVRG